MKYQLLTALLASALLTACGGGGGSTTPPTSGGSGTTATVKLNAGFAVSGSTSQSRRRLNLAIRARQDSTLNGGIYPIADFWIPDRYLNDSGFPSVGESEVAYVTGGPVPTPAPTVTFMNESGPILTVIATPSPLPAPVGLPQGATIIGGQIVGAGTQTGQSAIAVSAMNQTAQITANTYPASAIGTGGIYNTGPTGLVFTESGAQPANGTPDLSVDTSQSISALSAPSGIVEVQKPIDQVTTADFVQNQSVTTLRDVNLCNNDGTPRSFVLNTTAGVLVKLQLVSMAGSNVGPGVCSYNQIYFMYQATAQNGFAF